MAKSTRGMRSATSAHSASHCPDEGEIISLDFDLQLGSEQKGRRPALVLSPKAYNSVTKLCIVCPITNKVKNYPFEVALPENVDGLTGVVLSDQVKNLSWDVRGSKYLGEAPAGVVFQVKEEDEGEGASRDPLKGACRSLPPRRTRERLTADAGRRLSPIALLLVSSFLAWGCGCSSSRLREKMIRGAIPPPRGGSRATPGSAPRVRRARVRGRGRRACRRQASRTA